MMPIPPIDRPELAVSRRAFLGRASFGLGAAALARLQGGASSHVLPHHRPRAKRVIFLCMAGGPSQFETFDYKPTLAARDGEPMPSSVTAGQPIAQLQGQELRIMGARARFLQHGQSGQWISDLLPCTARIADRLAVVRSMTTTQINHDPAHTVMNTGTQIPGRPSMGSWITYGLGSEADDLPGFVVMSSIKGRNPQPIAARQWHSGFLPSRYQGVELQTQGAPVHYLETPPGMDRDQQRDTIDTVAALTAAHPTLGQDREVRARLAQYELALRMQMSVPALADLSDEPRHILDLYGVDGLDGSFAANCLMARRLVELGVRFVHLYHRGWDHHGGLDKWMPICCHATDRGTAALVSDLAQRGLLEDTLVVWGGEFGRTPMVQHKDGGAGRDHHIRGFTMWLCGGGIRGGVAHGATDELGYHAVDDIVSVHDLHATMLHLLGIDHERFHVRQQGLDMRLTGVEPARVVRALLA